MAPVHSLLTDAFYAEHVAFWTSALATIDDDFHVRQPWLSAAAAPGGVFRDECAIAPETATLVGDLGRGQDLGVLVVVGAAVAWLLHVYSRADVVAFDAPQLAGAEPDETREMVPIIAPIDAGQTVRDYLKALGERVAGSYSHQPFPVAQLSEIRLKKPRPTTNVLVTLDGLHAPASAPDSYDLRITIARQPALTIRLEGRSPAFSAAYLKTFTRHLGHVLEGFRDLSRPLGEIDVMGAEERQRLLVDYNATGTHAAPGRTVGDLFEEQANRAPSAIAIRLRDAAVTYDELNRSANRLARFLQTEYGIQKGDVVGIVTHRSPETMAGLLAVLKAGAVYLPIDPDYPEERLQFMVADAAVKVLLVQSEHFDRLATLYETPMFALDLQLGTLETAEDNLEPVAAANDLAYIIYTSGSTGQPKAVLLEHGGFVNMVRHHAGAFGIEPSDRLLQFYAHSFDSSLFEIFVALLSGATLVMVDRDTINDPEQLSRYVEAQQVTMLTLPPVYLSTLDKARLTRVRRYISAGDHCRVEDALALARASDYYNSYGPTETSVCVTHYQVDPQRQYGSRIPIGKPITATAIYLLDDQLKPVPEGVVGEICVGGVSLARGYLNRDELTAEKFVSSPFVDAGRLYLTGDIGVWLPDGNLEVIGRKDNQVKIRGYRVELGEIESVLDQHPLVKESAVIAREDEAGHKRLVAYVTGNAPIEIADLKTLLRSRLPEFMVPAVFMVLERMPLTANGKIDRKALPVSLEPAAAADPSAGVPQNQTQETLARIWQDVLGVERVGIHDNLFDLGGDSILVIQIVSRAREAGLKLSPNQLFDHQTVAQLSEVAVVTAPGSDLAGEQGVVEGPAPLTPMQAWFFEQGFADAHYFNQSACLDVPADVDASAIETAVAALLEHHDALRLTFAQAGGRWTAEYATPCAAVPFDVVDLSAVAADRLDAALRDAVASAQSGFDLATGPLFRVRLIRLAAGQPSRLVVVAHHLVVDGVSWRIVLGDLFTAFSQRARAEQVALPAKTTSYRAWAMGLEALAAGANAPASAYWLTDRGPAGPLPVDHQAAAGANTVASACEITRALDPDTTAALLQEVPRAYTTEINDVLLAGLALTLSAWTGRHTVTVDLEGHGREDLLDEADTSRTVGWFTSQFPVQLTLGEHDSPGDTIKSIKEQLRAVPQRGAGYGVLRYLSPDAALVGRLRARPQPEVLFNYFGQAGRGLAADLQWTLLPGSAGQDVSPRAVRPHALEINGIVADGQLSLTWTYSEALHRRATIEDLASRYESTLRLLVDHCCSIATPQHTPSDFPGAKLDQKSLDALIAKLNR